MKFKLENNLYRFFKKNEFYGRKKFFYIEILSKAKQSEGGIEMKDTIYTDQQLLHMSQNFELVHMKLRLVLNKIAEHENGIPLHEISKETGVGEYVRNKCISALELPGLVTKYIDGTEKRCRLTREGKRLIELLKSETN